MVRLDDGQDLVSVQVPKVVAENIEQLIQSRKRQDEALGFSHRVADRITYFSGSMSFLLTHAVFFGVWIVINLGWVPGVKPFDPFPFGLINMAVSLEAILLSAVILISQNRTQEMADRRAELDLHVNLLAEREASTILKKLARIESALKIRVDDEEAQHVEELVRDTNPVDIVSTIEETTERHS